jgi:Coenzyme PQQ synthesis protein D (PqqD)
MAELKLNRRRFLIRLGAGAAGGIGGFFLLQRWPVPAEAAAPAKPPISLRPRLRKDIADSRYAGMAAISYGRGAQRVLCAINRPGRMVTSRLDGRHTIEQIAQSLASELALDAPACLEAPVAQFVAQLGMLGFLAEPFYATIYYEITQTHGS